MNIRDPDVTKMIWETAAEVCLLLAKLVDKESAIAFEDGNDHEVQTCRADADALRRSARLIRDQVTQ